MNLESGQGLKLKISDSFQNTHQVGGFQKHYMPDQCQQTPNQQEKVME